MQPVNETDRGPLSRGAFRMGAVSLLALAAAAGGPSGAAWAAGDEAVAAQAVLGEGAGQQLIWRADSTTLAAVAGSGAVRLGGVAAAGNGWTQPQGSLDPVTEESVNDPEAGPSFYIRGNGGYQSLHLPEFDLGVVVTAEGRDAAFETEDYISGAWSGGGFGFSPKAFKNIFFELSGYRLAGRESFSAAIAPGGDQTAIVFQDAAPSGAGGIDLGTNGLDVAAETDGESFRVDFRTYVRTFRDFNTEFGSYFGLTYLNIDQEHTVRFTAPGLGDSVQVNSFQRVQDEYAGIFTGARWNEALTNWLGLSMEGGIFGLYRDNESLSEQDVICGICAGPDQAFSLENRPDSQGFTYAFSGDFDLHVAIGRVLLGGTASVLYVEDVGQLVNRLDPADIAAGSNVGLDSDDSLSFRFGGFVTVRL